MIKLQGKVKIIRMSGALNVVPTAGNPPLQGKTVIPTHEEQIVKSDEDYYGLSVVTVAAVPRIPAAEAFAIVDVTRFVTNHIDIQTESGITIKDGIKNACYTPSNSTAYSLTGTIEAGVDDWILATVTTRSTATYPDDWTLLHETGYVTSSDGTNQKMAFLCKKVDDAGTVNFTVQQTANARIYLNLLIVGNCSGFAYHEGNEKLYNSEASSFTVTRPEYERLIWGCSGVLWSTGSWKCNEIFWPVIDMGSTIASRQANFIDEDEGTSRTFTPISSTIAIIDCVEVLS